MLGIKSDGQTKKGWRFNNKQFELADEFAFRPANYARATRPCQYLPMAFRFLSSLLSSKIPTCLLLNICVKYGCENFAQLPEGCLLLLLLYGARPSCGRASELS